MPELPEVETVRRGLAPVMEGFIFERVELRRANLRFPFPDDFAARIEGQTLTRLGRRAKFLDAQLSSGERLLMHLGMSGRFTIDGEGRGEFVHDKGGIAKHDHVIFHMSSGHRVIYNDPRRFGFMQSLCPMNLTRLYCGRLLRGRKVRLKRPCSISILWRG